jgi:threonine dehydrogenase-like Zn-dependent dehydrogenase
MVHVLGPGVSLLDAALAEPAAVAWRAISRGGPRPGESVAVVGDGTVGLIAAHLLRLYSPASLVVYGQRQDQAELAMALGATGFETAQPPAAAQAPAAARAQALAQAGPHDLVVEAAGSAGAVERAIGLARRGGRVVLVGLAGNGVQARLPIDDVVNNDLLIAASFGYTSAAFGEVAALLSAGQIRLGPLVTHQFPLAEYEPAYAALRSATGPRGKVMLEVHP